ncbi:MAG: radical SAM protein [Blastochloris sp.]|nr:radical SAM protein [Blastochloris sp.]
MRLTQLAQALDDGRWRCGVCQWRCNVASGETGRCLVRVGQRDGIAVENDSVISAANVGPIEDHRLWHCFPGAAVLAIGGWGYAFPADQQRGQYATLPVDEQARRRLAPERAATFALERLCRGVVWTFSDPSVAQEYVLDLLQSARASSRFTAVVTSGYMTEEALDQIGHYLDAMSFELRAFDSAAYERLAGIDEWRGVLAIAERAKERWNCHIEVTTRLHPNVNDAPEHLYELARWIHDALGPYTPWHVLPGDAGAAAAATVGRARRIGHEVGLHFIYTSDRTQHTLCPSCNAVAIERNTETARLVNVDDGRCTNCGAHLHIRTSLFKR